MHRWCKLTRNVLMLVLLEMAVEVGLLTKAAVAQVTLEGFLLVMDVANVALKIGWDAEWAVTVFTPATGEQECEGELREKQGGAVNRECPSTRNEGWVHGIFNCPSADVSKKLIKVHLICYLNFLRRGMSMFKKSFSNWNKENNSTKRQRRCWLYTVYI